MKSRPFQPICGRRRPARRHFGHVALDPAEPRGDGVFQAAFGHQLHADADAQERRAAAGRGLDRLAHAWDGGEAGGAVGEGPLAGQNDTVSGGDHGRIGSDGDSRIDAGPFRRQRHGARGGRQVAAAVVDDRDPHGAMRIMPAPAGSGRRDRGGRTAGA